MKYPCKTIFVKLKTSTSMHQTLASRNLADVQVSTNSTMSFGTSSTIRVPYTLKVPSRASLSFST